MVALVCIKLKCTTMKKINGNDLIGSGGVGCVAGVAIAQYIHNSDTSACIGGLIGLVYMIWFYFRQLKEEESKEK